MDSIAECQKNLLKKYPEIDFSNVEIFLEDYKIVPDIYHLILSFLEGKIQNSFSKGKHFVLITLSLKSDILHAKTILEEIIVTHDVLIRVNTDEKGFIEHLIFSDIHNTGIFLFQKLN